MVLNPNLTNVYVELGIANAYFRDFLSQIRNHRRAELGISPIPGNVFKELFFSKKIWRP
jgi:hypothetical protein